MEKAHFIENRVFKDKRGAFSPLELTKLDKPETPNNHGFSIYQYGLKAIVGLVHTIQRIEEV